jgi:hypothetical protein
MNMRHAAGLLCLIVLVQAAQAEEKAPKKQATEEEIRARLADHARKKPDEPVKSKAPAAAKPAPTLSPTAAPVAVNEVKPTTAGTVAPTAPEVLPKVEVRKERITELDRQVDQQNREIAREKKNTKPTPLDETLNGSKVSGALALFGGQSSSDRSAIAQERVSMMEEERDMIEAIAQATTKEEKEQLQKTLNSMKEMRRELERSLR